MTEDFASALAALGSATLGESGGHPMAPRIRPAWTGARVCGPAYPIACSPGDNLAVHAGVVEAPPGSVLVVSVGLEPARGYWGEVLTTAAQARGIAGLVIDGGVRDVDALTRLDFPVFSSMIALRGATKTRPGHIGDSALVGDVEVGAGDYVVADVDGVTTVRANHLADVLAAGRAREAKEREMFEALRSGKTTVELLGLDASQIRRP